MTYDEKRILAILLTVVAGGIALVQAGNAELLGLTPRILAWLGILNGVLALGLAFLPSVRGTEAEPEHIANRIMELTLAERRRLLDDLEERRRAEMPPPHG